MENSYDQTQTVAGFELPHSIEAEQSVLGSILYDPNVLAVVLEKIKPECFFLEQHRQLFSIMVRMFSDGSTSDIVTVLNEALAMKIFDTEQEGKHYLASMVQSVPSVSNVEDYCNIVAEKYYARTLAATAQQILSDIASGGYSASSLLDSAEQKIYDIRQGRDTTGLTPLNDVVYGAYDQLAKITGPDKEKYLGARTGFTKLDTYTTGLNRSDLIILAARPAMGKTSFAMNIALNVARKTEKQVAVFSLEMSKEQLATRLLSTEALVDSKKLRSGLLEKDDWMRLASSADTLCRMPMLIDDTPGITVQQMKAKLRRVKNLGLVVIDYLQLMNSTLKTDNRVVIISEITRQLKIMAKELDVPIILLSQLSRGPESRTDKRPMLSDLRESGSIEQDADIVMFLYRDAYYNPTTCTSPNVSECIVAKNRHGEVGTVEMVWDGQFTRFANKEG
ncbi:MAG: replicative DNA helicase [Oscillospiraceae bacterium]|nr:replicative DNA helicase [Oscillospiraceae bacterium]MBR3536664.1 replicative DNA helicase [Oscillospiraceae bacterium]MBR6925180.1 replicative DNA helicase [Oscillospiraceae bacterium]